jgi:hypothetical protein
MPKRETQNPYQIDFGGNEMSLLRKIIETIRLGDAQQEIQKIDDLMAVAAAPKCLTSETALVDSELESDDQRRRQRRYYVKTGSYVYYEEEVSTRAASAQMVVRFDKTPADLKSLFPKLSLR